MARRAPGFLKVINPLNRFLLARGIGPAPQRLLAIPGRRTGVIRTTPVAVVEHSGERFVVSGFADSDWVRNARRAGRGELRRGHHRETVVLREVPVGERGPILRAFAARVRGGRSFLTVGADASAEEFARAAARAPDLPGHRWPRQRHGCGTGWHAMTA
jgi:deazaflavin-dependent oxidoreductase (nitroreductase family)